MNVADLAQRQGSEAFYRSPSFAPGRYLYMSRMGALYVREDGTWEPLDLSKGVPEEGFRGFEFSKIPAPPGLLALMSGI